MAAFDAVVVGAGPAGATAARELAAAGARVLVIDGQSFPRYKACGGGIPVKTQRLLPFPIDSVLEDLVDRIGVSYRGRPRFECRSSGPFSGMVMRDRFDALLLDQAARAGAEVRTGSPVRSTRTEGTPAVICEDGFEASASFIVCADGAHSPVGRMLGLGRGLAECAAWEVEVNAPARQLAENRGRALVDVGYRPWGYAWQFPKQSVLSIGIVLPPGQAPELRAQLEAFLRARGLGDAPVSVRRGHKIRFRRDGEPIAGPRAVAVGDAAGMADEFTQEGIFYGIQSGRLAARGILRAIGGDGSTAGYQRDVEEELMPELRAARTIGRLFYAGLGRMPGPWLTASRLMPGLWGAFFAVQRGESSYARELRRVPRPLREVLLRPLKP